MEEQLVDLAFGELGKCLGNMDDATGQVVNIMIQKYDIDPAVAQQAVAMAFDQWVDIYYPD